MVKTSVTNIKLRKPKIKKLRSVLRSLLAKEFNKAIVVDLNYWLDNSKICLLQIINHVTRYGATKKKKYIKIFFWLDIENCKFFTVRENFNIKIYATVTEKPWMESLNGKMSI